MTRALKYFISLLVLGSAFVSVEAQESMSHDLDLYEQICSRCLDLKIRLADGEQVSKSEAENTISFFVELNRKLKAAEGNMTVIQRQRFKDISQWFATGKKQTRPAPLPELVYALPETLSHNQITSIKTDTCEESLPEIESRASLDYFTIAEVAAPDFSYGARIGVMASRLGAYASFRSNFVFGDTVYECTSDGNIADGRMFWPSGKDRVSNMTVMAGALCKVADNIGIYTGAGYGWRLLQWQDISGNWAEVYDWSHRGVCAEAGLIFSYRKLVFSAGLSSVGFKTFSAIVGVGVRL